MVINSIMKAALFLICWPIGFFSLCLYIAALIEDGMENIILLPFVVGIVTIFLILPFYI